MVWVGVIYVMMVDMWCRIFGMNICVLVGLIFVIIDMWCRIFGMSI